MHSRVSRPTSSSVPSVRYSCFLIALVVIFAGLFTGTALADCANPKNAIEVENCLPGTPASAWDISNQGDTSIQGFATDISVNVGQTVFFKINSSNATAYAIDIYRMGYYGGNGARKVATISPSVSLPQSQPNCLTDNATGLADCGNWAVSASWTVPANAVSGIYFARPTRTDNGGASHIVFIVRNDASHSDLLFQTSDLTWHAYNNFGGHSLYGASGSFDLPNRGKKVSYNRPFWTRSFEAASWVFNAEYPMVRFLEANGYDVSYFTGVDAARSSSLILNHKVFVSTGHDEYWSGPGRTSVEAARDGGVNLAFFSGNEVFWKTRWENSIDGSNTPFRTIVCYKETLDNAKTDPQDPPTWTGTWRDPRFSPPADGGRPENSLTGTIFAVNGPGSDNNGLAIKVPAADGKMRFWRNTNIATQTAGATVTLPAATLGYEWDITADNGAQPGGTFYLSTATYQMTSDLLIDYGGVYGSGPATHHLTLYRAPSGALVFGAGTVQWSWGLDKNHDTSTFAAPNPDVRMQQATVNLFADMGVQPGTLISGLVAATKSTDATAPSSTITSPASGTTVSGGATVNLAGTATDVGGVVAAVEISTDNKLTWHPANGRASWTYSFTAPSSATLTIFSRAVDDTGNIETPTSSITIIAGSGGGGGGGNGTCTGCIWPSGPTPATTDSDTNSVEVGVKFRSDVAGSVTAIRFYKPSTNTGSHTGHLWTSTGTLLGSVTFTGETASGWQQQSFTTPVPINANTTYVVSYHTPSGHYSTNSGYFTGFGVDTPPLHALASGVDGPNGVYAYSSSTIFPNLGFADENHWVDLVFAPSGSSFSISGTISGAGGNGATVTLSGAKSATTTADASGNYTFASLQNGSYTVTPTKAGATFTPASQNVTVNGANVTAVNFTSSLQTFAVTGTVSGATVSGVTISATGTATASTTTDASGNYTLNLGNGSYTITPTRTGFTFSPVNLAITVNGAALSGNNFVSSAVVGGSSFTIWNTAAAPAAPADPDTNATEVGVRFRSDVDGTISGIRFYKGTTNTGTHTGSLWSNTGTLLATATFGTETASGWQQVNFTTPVNITANTVYVASYHTAVGHYAADASYFATAGVDNVPLHALADGVSGANGVYIYSAGGVFPTNTFQSTNYWVDVVFNTAGPTYSISGNISGTGASGTTVTLTGTSSASTTADASGNFTFTGLANGSYTVTPTKSGLTFAPLNQTVTISGANATAVNFTATGNTYNITGNISGAGGNGATVTLSGTASATTTADASGNFTFAGQTNGSYTVTPSRTGFVFSPVSQNVTVAGADQTSINFTSAQTYSIGGTISGNGGNGATVTLTGSATATVSANSSGVYLFTGLLNGSYTVTPTKVGFAYTPASQNLTVAGANLTGLNFTSVSTGLGVDVTTFTDRSTNGSTIVSPAFTTTSTNELLLAFVATDGATNSTMTVTGVTGAGVTWTLVRRTNTQRGTAEIWRAFSPTIITAAKVTATLSRNTGASITVVSFTGADPSGTGGSGAIGAIGGGNGVAAPTASIVTTRANSWVFGVGNDWDKALARTLGPNQTMIHQYLATVGDTFWVQRQNASAQPAGTTVTINDTAPTTDRYNLSLVEILPAP
jgi:Domain of unknown function (DUF4082)/Bacterial Ig domain